MWCVFPFSWRQRRRWTGGCFLQRRCWGRTRRVWWRSGRRSSNSTCRRCCSSSHRPRPLRSPASCIFTSMWVHLKLDQDQDQRQISACSRVWRSSCSFARLNDRKLCSVLQLKSSGSDITWLYASASGTLIITRGRYNMIRCSDTPEFLPFSHKRMLGDWVWLALSQMLDEFEFRTLQAA